MPEAFQFKQFSIQHKLSGMKVGTDGVLLGAWTNCQKANNILDVGAGTGLISLILAQRNSTAKIVSVEIDSLAFKELERNIKASKWANRVNACNVDFRIWKSNEQFDLIVSNPPFFNGGTKIENTQRSQARDTTTLSHEELFEYATKHLKPDGVFSLVLPISELNKVLALATHNKLFEVQRCLVKGNVESNIVRVLLEFSNKQPESPIHEELAIEIERHVYTPEYIALVKDFYLKM